MLGADVDRAPGSRGRNEYTDPVALDDLVLGFGRLGELEARRAGCEADTDTGLGGIESRGLESAPKNVPCSRGDLDGHRAGF